VVSCDFVVWRETKTSEGERMYDAFLEVAEKGEGRRRGDFRQTDSVRGRNEQCTARFPYRVTPVWALDH
jgi:hypothetical protein